MGTGKFASGELMAAAIAASGAELVTVALRRADLTGGKDKFANILIFSTRKSICFCRIPAARARLKKRVGLPGSVGRRPARHG